MMMMREGQWSSRQAQTRSWREKSNARRGRCEMQMQDAGSNLGKKTRRSAGNEASNFVTAQQSLLAVGSGVGRESTSVVRQQ